MKKKKKKTMGEKEWQRSWNDDMEGNEKKKKKGRLGR